MDHFNNITQYFRNNRSAREWLLASVFIAFGANLAYRMAFYPGAVLSPAILVVLIFILALWRPVYGLGIYCLLYPFVPSTESLNLQKLSVLGLFALILVIWLYNKLKARQPVLSIAPYRYMLMLFVYISLSPFLGTFSNYTLVDWARDIAPLLNLMLIPVIADYLKNLQNRWLVPLIMVPVALGFVRDILFLIARYGLPSLPWLGVFTIGLSTLHPPLMFSMGVLLFIKRIAPRTLWLILALLGILVGSLTDTRTIWLAFILSAAMILLFYTRYRKQAIAIIVILMLATSLIILQSALSLNVTYHQEQRLNQMLNYRDDLSFQNRRDEFEQSGALFLSSPLYGVGFGYQYNFYRFITGKGYGHLETNYTHSDIMNILAKGGVIGMLLFVLLYGSLFRLFNARRRVGPSTIQSAWAIAGIITLILSIFTGLTTPVLQTREASFIMAMMLGLCITRSEPKQY